MPVFSVTCKECRATLKSPKPIPAGKVITCPKCGVMFAAPKPQPVAVPKIEVIDDVEILEDVEIVEDEPKGKSAPGKKRSEGDAKPRRRVGKPKRAKMGALGLILLIGGCLGGVAALGVGGLLVWKYVINAPSDAVSYAPNDSNIIFGADIGKISAETSLGQGIDMMLNGTPSLGTYFRSTNTQPRSLVDRIVVGGSSKTTGFAVSLFSKSAIDKTQLVQALAGKPRSLGSQEGYASALLAGTPFMFNTSRSLTFIRAPGSEETIAAQIGKGVLPADLSTMVTKASGGHVWVVADIESLISQLDAVSAFLPPQAQAMLKMLSDTKCVGVWWRFANPDVQFTAQFQFKSGVAMATKLQEVQKQLSDDKTAMNAPDAVNKVQAQYFSLAVEYANSATASVQGDCVVVKAKVKQSIIEPLLATLIRQSIPAPPGR